MASTLADLWDQFGQAMSDAGARAGSAIGGLFPSGRASPLPPIQWNPDDPNDPANIAMSFAGLGMAKPAIAAAAKYASRYPKVAAGVEKVDPISGKTYLGRGQSAEAADVEKLRAAASKDIKAGNYDPMFPLEERYHVDPSNYPVEGSTIEQALPKKPATIEKWVNEFDTPATRQRLQDAYAAGSQSPLAHNWYAMGQLEDAFVKELGPDAGRQAFRDMFANAMAATTGGNSPTVNLLTAAYGNFMRNLGKDVPTASVKVPYPVSGRYLAGNLDMYNKVLNAGQDLTAAGQPKRFNFAANFMGHQQPSTIDEQMMTLFDPAGKYKGAPPGDSYGVLQRIIDDEAAKAGVSPQEFQAQAWAGAKGSEGKPMMQHVNEMIYRTSQVTGKSAQDVLRGFIRGDMPMYSGFGMSLPDASGTQGAPDDAAQ